MDKIILGSQTAKNGFRNEDFVVNTFNQYQTEVLAQEWLKAMGYKLDEIKDVQATKIKGSFKADVQVTILVKIAFHSIQDVQNLQVKLVSNPNGFNQIDKRWFEAYRELWNIPQDVLEILKYFVGELPPTRQTRDSRRMFFDEFTEIQKNKVLDFFKKNQVLILNDILKGRGKFASEWFLVILKLDDLKWVLKPINEVINFYSGRVEFSPQGSLKIGKITMQRKGGDGGRETAKMLQFKTNPCLLFE